MNGALALTALAFVFTLDLVSPSKAGALDAPAPVIRDHSIHVDIEEGYIDRDELSRLISGVH